MSEKTFVNIYLNKCKEFSEEPDKGFMVILKQLDEVINSILNQVNFNQYKQSLNNTSIAIPFELAHCLYDIPENYFDVENKNGEKFYLSKAPFDLYRAKIMKILFEPERSIILLQWKIRRIEKVIILGWDEYIKQYKR